MKTIDLHVSGVTGLMTHNERLANKTDPIVRQIAEITSKRKKTDADLVEIARLEVIGGCYTNDAGKVGIPAWNIFRAIQDGARLNKLGKAVERAVVPLGADIALIAHDGPDTPEDLWAKGCWDSRSVKVGTSKVTRSRPMFRNWSIDVSFALDEEILNEDDFRMCASNGGRLSGLGDYRPRFGRFEIA